MTCSKGASSARLARPFDFPMFSTIPYPKPHVTKVRTVLFVLKSPRGRCRGVKEQHVHRAGHNSS